MIIRDLAIVARGDTRATFANIVWEEQPYPEQVLTFEVLAGTFTAMKTLRSRVKNSARMRF
jgi:hypothetical protein